MNSSIASKDPSSLFNGVPIGTQKNKGNASFVSAGKYSAQSSFNNQDVKINVHTPQGGSSSSMEGLLQRVFRGQYETASAKENHTEVGDNMDDSTKLLLERIERDSREREARYHKDAQEREQRYREEILEQDRRWKQEAKEREERILNAIKENADRTEKKIDSVEEEIRLIKTEVASSVKHSQSLVTTNMWGFIATIVAIVALTVTVFLTR
ncbi:hypothetical protein [Paenibacillus kribbensis]|uniref:hypothetical protein n=1 Tax=Paenibacillus kribbensis TaxID=172713 RepID=UPI00083870B3|nr:hypothetical protein [Paenibacillus kribbensis]